MNVALPFSAACERNKGPILEILRDALAQTASVVEVGSGTGQHAVHFARQLPHLTWQPTDREEWLPGLRARVVVEGPPNLLVPFELDVLNDSWSAARYDAVYTANTLHIMSWPEVRAFFRGLESVLEPQGLLAIYGPFNIHGKYTSASNAVFDADLKARDPASGLRDLEAVDELAGALGLERIANHRMPANNQLVLWRQPQRCATAAGR